MHFKLVSWNVNGVRAVMKKGFWDWYDKTQASIVSLQETKITDEDFTPLANENGLIPLDPQRLSQLDLETKRKSPPIYYEIATAKKAGYSGVATLSTVKPKEVIVGLGESRFDNEGRVLFIDFEKFLLVNTYFPNAQRDLNRINYKIEFSDCLLEVLKKKRQKQPHIIICGDMNVAHTEIDIKNPKSNENNSGFTKIERDWFTRFLSHGYVDTFRHLKPDARDVYSWWSYRPGVRERNIGWRIDYFIVTKEMLPFVKKAEIDMKQNGSDHCPVILEIQIP
jgi:exodeoxyribonuclease-3